MTTCNNGSGGGGGGRGGSSNTGDNTGGGDGSKSGSMPLSNLYEVALCVEGYNIDGSAAITENILSVKGSPISSYDYEFWKDAGTGSMTIGGSTYTSNQTGTSSNGNFSCSWVSTPNYNFLARAGKKWTASNQTHTQIGDISVKYNATYSPTGGGVSYLCVYGWFRNNTSASNSLIEYYIVDNWGTYNRPPGSWANAKQYGSFSVDGGTYDIYVSTRTNQPSINGTRTFQQYWSVRTGRRTSGTISVSEHFKKWESIQ